MSDNYSIDDILAEVDRKRSSSPEDERGEFTESVTDIIGGNELDRALRSVGARRRRTESEIAEQELAEQREHEQRAEEIRAAAQKDEPEDRSAKKRREEAERRARKQQEEEERKARKQREEEEREQRRLETERRLAEERERIEREEQERLEAERAAAEEAARLAEQERPHTGFTAEMSSPGEAAMLFDSTAETELPVPVQPESEHVQPYVKPAVSGDDEDIIFHTRSDLVTTNTQQIRKQQRIEEINRALLEADMSAESPDELMDSLNPMESRAKAAEDLKNSEQEQEIDDTDTIAVAGNDLKRLSAGEEEHVKEYSPVISRRKSDEESRLDAILGATGIQAEKTDGISEKERRGSDALLASLNKRLKEQREKSILEQRTVTLNNLSGEERQPTHPLNINYGDKIIDTSVLSKTDPVAAVREADELAARKKRRISGFILADIEEEVDSAGEEDDDEDDEEEEAIDLDDENVISERLTLAFKGLVGRLALLGVITAAALFVAIVKEFRLCQELVENLANMMTVSISDVYLVTYLVIGILSFSACSSVVTNGFSRLVKLKPDGDTLCAFAHVGSILALVLYMAQSDAFMLNRAHSFLIVSLTAMCFNTVSKLCTVRAAQNNFRFVSGDSAKYFAECSSGDGAERLAKGTSAGMPVVASMRKTEFLCDFIISTYCEDSSDRLSRVASPIVLALSLIAGAMAYFVAASSAASQYVMNNLAWGATVASAGLAIGSTFTGALIVMLPMLSASKRLTARNAAVLGCSAAEDFSAVTAVLTDAKSLFPTNSVGIVNIWDYNKNGKKGSQHIMIDEAIIFAASLAVSADSVLADAFFNMLNYKPELLKKVSNCVYESNMGVMGWIGSRRVLLGNRAHMKSHGVSVPDQKKENAANKNNNDVVYLAVGGEVCMLFFVELGANPQVKQHVKRLVKNGISLVIKTVDGMITEGTIAELFDINAENVRVIPSEAHEDFEERTKYVSKGSAAVSCDGTFSSFACAVNGAKSLREKIMFGCTMQIAGIALGLLLVYVFAAFTNYGMFNCFYLLLYNLAWLILTVIVQAFKRI